MRRQRYVEDFGDDKLCKCDHPYHRHFDSYDGMRHVGCKYCECFIFQSKDGKEPKLEEPKEIQQARVVLKACSGFESDVRLIGNITCAEIREVAQMAISLYEEKEDYILSESW